jgi:tetratricopeptide (TPR) repeat protein
MMRITRLEWYMEMDRPDEALKMIQEEEKKFKDSLTDLIAYGYMNYYLTLKDVPQAEIYLDKVRNHIDKYGSAGNIQVYYQAELNFIKEKYEDALGLFRNFKKTNVFVPQSIIDVGIAKCLWHVEEQAEAIQILQDFLILDPYHPEANYELALLFLEQGEKEKAIELLSICLQVWQSSDPEYRRAKAARDKYDQLTTSLDRLSS